MTTPTPSAPLRTLNCPTCGAPLEVNDTEPSIHCKYCNATVENPAYHPPRRRTRRPTQAKPVSGDNPILPPLVPNMKRKIRATTCVLILVVGLIVVGVGIYGVFSFASSLSSTLGGKGFTIDTLLPLQVDAPVMLLKGETANIIAETENIAANNYAVTRLDVGAKKVVWSALAQKDPLNIDGMLAGDTLLYVVMEDHLVALRLSDGKQAWEASLPDQLPGTCYTSCMLMRSGQVIVLTYDGSLGAYDALTGHQTWEKHFDSTGHGLYPAGDGVALTYSVDRGSALGIFDPATGKETVTIDPTCTPKDTGGGSMTDTLAGNSSLVFDNSSQPGKVYLLYGLYNTCIQRYDLATGAMDWEYIEADQSIGSSTEQPALLVGGKLIYVEEEKVRLLDASNGANPQTLEQDKSYGLVPLQVSGQRLLARAVRTQGTTRYELWGYDLTTGKNLWKRPVLDSSPLDPPGEMSGMIDSGSMAFTYQLSAGKLWLITFQTQPNQVNLAQLDLDTGELSNPQTLSLGIGSDTDYYDVPVHIESPDALTWFQMQGLIYAIDPSTGTFKYQYP